LYVHIYPFGSVCSLISKMIKGVATTTGKDSKIFISSLINVSSLRSVGVPV